jgi:hypothetical protein
MSERGTGWYGQRDADQAASQRRSESLDLLAL